MADYPSDVTNPPTDTTIGTTTENLSPDRYTYTTDTKSEKFKDVPYTPVSQPKFDLSPPSTFNFNRFLPIIRLSPSIKD